jgi:hypothetical protein
MSAIPARMAALVLLSIALPAAEPRSQDQSVIQSVLRQYVQAVNDCNGAALASAVTDFVPLAPGLGPLFTARLTAQPEACGPNRAPAELTMLARVLRQVTPEVVIADAYFRTMHHPEGDRAGRAYLTFLRHLDGWKLMNLRFHALEFERPYLGVPVGARHDSPGPDGWISLFDGSSTRSFVDITGGPIPELWRIEDGALRAVAAPYGKSIRTRDTYRSFELEFEWKTPIGGNSGVKYRLFYLMDSRIADGAGYEYQVADDTGDLGAIRSPYERSGALYNQIPPTGAHPRPAGEWNQSRLLVNGRHIEHWLNGDRVMEYDAESGPPEGPILFQHHGSDFWFRNIRVRRLD